jgi:hypothetical protein
LAQQLLRLRHDTYLLEREHFAVLHVLEVEARWRHPHVDRDIGVAEHRRCAAAAIDVSVNQHISVGREGGRAGVREEHCRLAFACQGNHTNNGS